MPFCRLFRFQIQIQYRYTPDTEVILLFIHIQVQLQLGYAPDTDAISLLIQIQSLDTVQIRSRYGHHYDTHSFDLQLAVQQTFLDGIYKPISEKILSPLQMTSLSPFPQLRFDECKFTGTLVSNPLLPSSRERQTCQSNSSGSRRFNRGNCCTPKFSLSFHQHFSLHDSWNSISS